MCGIGGFYRHSDSPLLRRMISLLEHRGPDDEGFYEADDVGLGMRRLSIIDLESGQQPIHNEDQTIWVVLNGEIYNYKTLRSSLEGKGHTFYTDSDTESIVHLYEDHGKDFVQHLRGMFSLALWDTRSKELIIARDRIGIKPLYYCVNNGSLFFASELKSLLVTPGFQRQIDPISFAQYLAFLYVPAPRTIFEKVYKLPPGHLLIASQGDVRLEPFWDLKFDIDETVKEEEAEERVLDILEESVRLRMISDVPLGAFLSGGLDSSAIVALMAQHTSKPVKTFTVGFGAEGQGFNELEYAKSVAQHFGTEHHECILDYNVVDLLPKVLWHFDEPFGNSTAILTYLLAEFTRQHVTVALSGTGGDEAFMGYPRYLGLSMGKMYSKIPAPIRKHVLGRAATLLPESSSSNFPLHRLGKRLRRFIDGMELSEDDRYMSWLIYFDQEARMRLTGRDGAGETEGFMYDYFRRLSDHGLEDRAFYTDVKSFLPYNQLEYMDKTSMACSLEARVPFCDHELLEYSATLPHSLKLQGMQTKIILKKACERIVPPEIVHRKKVGFDAPTGQWFKGSLKPFCEALFSESALEQTGNFDAAEVGRLMTLHFSGRRDFSLHLWSLMVFEVWYRMYIMNEIVEQPDYSLRDLLVEQGLSLPAA